MTLLFEKATSRWNIKAVINEPKKKMTRQKKQPAKKGERKDACLKTSWKYFDNIMLAEKSQKDAIKKDGKEFKLEDKTLHLSIYK